MYTGERRPHDSAPYETENPVFAAIDLGTNNCRLLVVEQTPAGSEVLDTFSRIIRLGEGLSQTGKLSDDAIDRAADALKVCTRKLSRFDITDGRYVATEACRKAANCQDFVLAIKRETGLLLEIIPHEEEARLAFTGCTPLIAPDAEYCLTLDIGGGSTEFMWAQTAGGPSILTSVSTPCGVMALTERFHDAGSAEAVFAAAGKYVRSFLDDFETTLNARSLMDRHRVQLLCTSGTVTTVAAIYMGLEKYDRTRIDGLTIAVGDIRRTIRHILAMGDDERRRHGCIGPDRADFMVSGCAILEAVFETWPFTDITIGDRGVREGIILGLSEAG